MIRRLQPYVKPMDIWMFMLDDPVGHEQRGEHPGIVIAVHKETQLCTIVPLTSKAGAAQFPGTWMITCSTQNKLTNDCVALTFQTTCASFERLTSKVGSLEQMQYDRVMYTLKNHLKL